MRWVRRSAVQSFALLAALSLISFAEPVTGQEVSLGIRWATYLGGPNSESVGALASNPLGMVTLGGYAFGAGFPTTSSAHQDENRGTADAVVATLGPGAGVPVYSSYLGGEHQDAVHDAAIDDSGAVYLVGEAHSSNFPTTPDVLQSTSGGGQDAFVAKVTLDGIQWATYLGGSGYDIAFGAAVGPDGSIYVTGRSSSEDFPTTEDALRRELVGRSDIFIARISPDGKSLGYSTLFGGSNSDARPTAGEAGRAIAIGDSGAVYITGVTDSSDFPVKSEVPIGTLPLGVRNGGGMGDAFVASFRPGDVEPLWSGYLGGIGSDSGSAIAVDGSGVVHVGGGTESPDFPTFMAGQPTHGGFGSYDGWIARIEPGGAGLRWSTFHGGSGNETVGDLVANNDGTIWLSGRTSSLDFPTTPDALSATYGGGSGDGFLSKIAPDGSSLVFSTYIGGSGDEGITGLARLDDNSVVVAGGTDSADFPVTPDALQANNAGGVDMFVALIGPPGPVKVSTDIDFVETSATSGNYSDEADISVRVTDHVGEPIVDGSVTFSMLAAEEQVVWNGTTDGNGIAAVRPRLDLGPGNYELVATFEGDEVFTSSSTAITFTVEREVTTTDLSVHGQGSKRRLFATLTEDDGPAIPSHEVSFFADGIHIGDAWTGGDGTAALDAPPGYRGATHRFEASFDGSDLYAGSRSTYDGVDQGQRFIF